MVEPNGVVTRADSEYDVLLGYEPGGRGSTVVMIKAKSKHVRYTGDYLE